MTNFSGVPKVRLPHLLSPRRAAVAIGAALALAGALPTGAALAEDTGGGATLTVRATGHPVALLSRLTVPELASLLGVSPASLAAELEVRTGHTGLRLCLDGVLDSRAVTVQALIGCLEGDLEPAAAEQAVEGLIAPLVSDPEGLANVLAAILGDIELNGEAQAVAGELGVASGELSLAGLSPATAETVAGALGTSVAGLSEALGSAGGGASPIAGASEVVAAPLNGLKAGVAQILGLREPGGGVSLVTVSSPAAPGATSTLAYRSTFVDNAFTIVSIKLNSAGMVVEKVKVPSAGRLSISANGVARIARSGGRSRGVGVRVAPRSGSIAAGVHSFTLRASPTLKRIRRTTLSLVTSYKPAGGTAYTKHKTVTFRPSTRKGANR